MQPVYSATQGDEASKVKEIVPYFVCFDFHSEVCRDVKIHHFVNYHYIWASCLELNNQFLLQNPKEFCDSFCDSFFRMDSDLLLYYLVALSTFSLFIGSIVEFFFQLVV